MAEKFQAMVMLGIANSPMKDFYDLWVLARQFDFQGPLLCQAILGNSGSFHQRHGYFITVGVRRRTKPKQVRSSSK